MTYSLDKYAVSEDGDIIAWCGNQRDTNKVSPMLAKANQFDALLTALKDLQGFADTSDVRHLWSEKGEQAALHGVLNNVRTVIRSAEQL